MRHSVSTTHEDITPAIAEKYLQKNTRNRPIRKARVDQLAADMSAGRWRENGEAGVTVDWNDELAGGQHTISAIIASGVTLRLRVTTGVEPEARSTMNDTAKQRFADDLHVVGVGNSSHAEALLRKIMSWERAEAAHNGSGGLGRWRWERFSRSELAEGWIRHAAGITRALDMGHQYHDTWGSTGGNYGAMEFMLWLLLVKNECSVSTVEDFFARLIMGSQDPEDRILLRVKMKIQKKPNTADYQVWALSIGWNRWVRGDANSKLQYPPASERVLPNPFPKIQRAR